MRRLLTFIYGLMWIGASSIMANIRHDHDDWVRYVCIALGFIALLYGLSKLDKSTSEGYE